ncbi:MAG TPA: glycosyltransferase, partial [Slackia equolifaciens]|nr:glycosyltransferase [Slackia equolifaciens]
MGDTPSLSVIIPIYNTERYLRECLESVLAQTLRGIEVVCVNDGSTDSSLSIMREYEDRDPRVRVVDKPNGGYGHSVNRGLSEARGEYVAVVEPD